MKRLMMVTALALLPIFSSPANAWICHRVSWWSALDRRDTTESANVSRSPDGQWTIIGRSATGKTYDVVRNAFTEITDKPPDSDSIAQWTGKTVDSVRVWTGVVLGTGRLYLKNNVLTYSHIGFDENGNMMLQMDFECDDDKVS